MDAWAEAKPLLDRLSHQPDARVNAFFQALTRDPGYGDYASMVLAWRGGTESLPTLQQAYAHTPTAGRALARGFLNDRAALRDLLTAVQRNTPPPSSWIMDDTIRGLVLPLQGVGVVSAESAFERLCHQRFELTTVRTRREKKKVIRKAVRWLDGSEASLVFRSSGAYFAPPAAP